MRVYWRWRLIYNWNFYPLIVDFKKFCLPNEPYVKYGFFIKCVHDVFIPTRQKFYLYIYSNKKNPNNKLANKYFKSFGIFVVELNPQSFRLGIYRLANKQYIHSFIHFAVCACFMLVLLLDLMLYGCYCCCY